MKTLFLKSGVAMFIFASFLLSISSCTQSAADPTFEPSTIAETNIKGIVVNQANLPQANVQIQIGNQSTTTSSTGTYSISGSGNSDGYIYLTAKKSGFIEGSKTFKFTPNTTFNVKIMLVSNTVTQTINTGVISTVTLPNNTRVKFPRFYVDRNNQPYEGAVTVSMYQLLESNINKKYVNYGFAVNNNGTIVEQKLKVFGTIIIEMRGSSGQLLDISSTSSFQAIFVLENSQVQTTPTSLVMLLFDDVNGYWEYSGQATPTFDSEGVSNNNERTGSSIAKANRYNFSRSNRKGGIMFVGKDEIDIDVNTEMGVEVRKK